MSLLGHSRRFGRVPTTSAPPPSTDIVTSARPFRANNGRAMKRETNSLRSGDDGLDPPSPRSRTSLTASILNSRLNFRLRMTTSGCMKHPIRVSIKPAAAQIAFR